MASGIVTWPWFASDYGGVNNRTQPVNDSFGNGTSDRRLNLLYINLYPADTWDPGPAFANASWGVCNVTFPADNRNSTFSSLHVEFCITDIAEGLYLFFVGIGRP